MRISPPHWLCSFSCGNEGLMQQHGKSSCLSERLSPWRPGWGASLCSTPFGDSDWGEAWHWIRLCLGLFTVNEAFDSCNKWWNRRSLMQPSVLVLFLLCYYMFWFQSGFAIVLLWRFSGWVLVLTLVWSQSVLFQTEAAPFLRKWLQICPPGSALKVSSALLNPKL